jgi:hypothetical protein
VGLAIISVSPELIRSVSPALTNKLSRTTYLWFTAVVPFVTPDNVSGSTAANSNAGSVRSNTRNIKRDISNSPYNDDDIMD